MGQEGPFTISVNRVAPKREAAYMAKESKVKWLKKRKIVRAGCHLVRMWDVSLKNE